MEKKIYYTLAQINELKRNGFTSSEADYYVSVYEHYQPLIELIQHVFRGVTLEDGIGLWEAQAIDDHRIGDEYQSYKERDERKDWSKLINIDLNRCSSSLSFFDAKGMRFCLPAYLIASIQDVYREDILGCITDTCYSNQYLLLNEKQKKTIVKYLTYPYSNAQIKKYPSFQLDKRLSFKSQSESDDIDILNALEFWEQSPASNETT